MGVDDRPHHRKAETGAAGIPAAGRIAAPEPVKGARFAAVGKTRAFVDDLEDGVIPAQARRQAQSTGMGRIAARV